MRLIRRVQGRRHTEGTQRAPLRQRCRERLAQGFRGARQGLRTRADRMEERAGSTRTGTRAWAVLPAAVGMALVGGMFQLVSTNVMAVNFTTGNNNFKVYSNYLDAQKAAAFLSPTSQQDGTQQGVAELGIKTARLAGLCAVVSEELPAPLSTVWSLKITAGLPVPDEAAFTGTGVPDGVTTNESGQLTNGAADLVEASNLFLNSDLISGYGNLISGLNLGQSAETVATSAELPSAPGFPAGGTQPQAGKFGLYARQLNVAGLNGDTFGINLAGDIKLPNLKLSVEPGALGQNDCS